MINFRRSFFLFFALSLPFSANALYNGPPNLPEMPRENLFLKEDSPFSVKLDYEGDFLLGRKIKTSSSFSNPSMRSMLNGGEVSVGFIDRVEVYTLLGAFKPSISAEKEGHFFEIKMADSFGGEMGVRALAAFWGDTKLGFDAKYFYGWPHVDTVDFKGHKRKAQVQKSSQKEWQVGVSLSQTFAFFTPYIGAKCARFNLNLIDISVWKESFLIENVSPFGVFIGLGIAGKKGPFCTFEARFLDEYGFSGSLGLRF